MGKCPYCAAKLAIDHLHIETKRLPGVFHRLKMFSCPQCDNILGFAESYGK